MKRWMWFLAIPAVLVLAVALAAKLYFTEERLKALIIPGIESSTGRTVAMGGISLSLFPSIGVSVEDFRLSNPPGAEFPNPYFLSLKSLFIDVRLLPLLSSRVEVDRVVLEDPVVYLDVTPEGRKNYSFAGGAEAAASGEPGTSAPSAAGLLVSAMEVTNGRIESFNRKLDTRWTIDSLDQTLRIGPAPDGRALAITGTSDIRKFSYGSGSSWYIEGLPLSADETMSYDLSADRLDLSAVDVLLKGVPLKVSGSIGTLTGDTLMMDLAVASPDLTVDRLLSLLPAATMKDAGDVTASGAVSFTANVTGPSSDELNPGIKAVFRMSDGTIRYASLPKSITGVGFDGVLDIPPAPVGAKNAGELEIGQLKATLGANALSGNLHVSGFGDPAVKAALRGMVALGELGEYYPLEPGTASGGTVRSDISIDGKPSDPRSIRASGTMNFRDVSWSSPAMEQPLRNLNGDAVFNNELLELKGVALDIGRSDVRLDATLKNYLSLVFPPEEKAAAKPFLNFTLKSKSLDTRDISSGGDAPAAKGPASGAGEEAGLILPGINMAGTVDVETLRTEKLTFTNAKGNVSMTDGVARLREMQLNAFGGVIKTDGMLDLTDPDRRPFDLKLDVKGVESNEMLSPFTTFGKFLFGKLNLTTALKGDIDDALSISASTLTGNGDALVENGKLIGVPLLQKLSGFLNTDRLKQVDFKSWSQSFTVADGKLNIRDLKIGGQDANFIVNGTHGLDGVMNYSMRVQLPQSVADRVKLQGIGDALLRFFKDKEGRLNLDFLVSGQVDSPVLKLDTRAQENALKQKLQDDAMKKLSDPLKKAAEGLKDLIKPKP